MLLSRHGHFHLILILPVKMVELPQYCSLVVNPTINIFFAFLNKYNSLGAATKWNAMETPDTLCTLFLKLPNGVVDRWKRKALIVRKIQQREPSLKDFIGFFDEKTVLVNDPMFLREAITAYVGNQEKSDNQRKRRNSSKKYGSFATDINYH